MCLFIDLFFVYSNNTLKVKTLKLLPLFFVLINVQILAQTSIDASFARGLSADGSKSDLALLKTGLEKLHPGLYRYSSQKQIDSLFRVTLQELNEPIDFQNFYRKICKILAEIRCQHTAATPAPDIFNKIEREGKFLPFGAFWEFDPVSVYVTYDLSSEASLPPGTKILEINGQSMNAIYDTLIPYFPTDGNNLTNKHSRFIYGLELHLWYYLLIDRPETFVVKLETPQKKLIKKRYNAVTAKELFKNYKTYTSQKDPALRRYLDYWKRWNKKNSSRPIRHEFIDDHTALLTVGNFTSHKFEKIIENAFNEINKKNIKNLIIDVRGNGGGSDDQGRKLFTYLIDKPSAYYDSLYTTTGISDTTFLFKHTDKNQAWYFENLPLVEQLPDGRFATKPEGNPGVLIQKPQDNNFSGDVYVIMNGRSASAASEFTAAVHFNRLATFVGEESGGAYNGGNGGDFAQFLLPNSKINVQIPVSRYVMNSSETKYLGRGTIPDYKVTRSIEDVLIGRDPQLEFVLQLIEGR